MRERLRALDVVNVGAAGTFVIRAPIARAELKAHLLRCVPPKTEIVICRAGDVARAASEERFFAGPARAGVTRFVSVLSQRARAKPVLPMQFPSRGRWLLRILGAEGRFVFGVYRRDMKVIGYLGALDRLFGVPVTTRNWNTMAAIARVLAERR
ncbi:MAG TPA: hypothetical protein VGI39_40855 [Polyangiaceae bacterium]